MSGSSPNLVVEAEMIRQRRIAEWQMASMGMVVGPAPPRWKIETGKPAQDKAQAFVDAFCGVEAVPVVQPVPTIQQAVAQALGALAVLSKCSQSVMGQSLIGIGAFVDPVAEPVVVAASKPVNPALARAMGCGSRQPIGFMVR